MSRTLLHAQSNLVGREQLMAIAPPPPTATWRPIAHGDLISALDRQLLVRGIRIDKEMFAIQREGARLFGVLDLALESSGEFCAAMGIRTGQRPFHGVGSSLWACACSSATTSPSRAISSRFGASTPSSSISTPTSRERSIRYQAHLVALQRTIAAARESAVSDDEAKGLIFERFRYEILPIRYFKQVAETYFNPAADMTDVQPRTMWGLHNAFTRAVRQMAPAPAFETTDRTRQVLRPQSAMTRRRSWPRPTASPSSTPTARRCSWEPYMPRRSSRSRNRTSPRPRRTADDPPTKGSA
jgi:hypothetical protein